MNDSTNSIELESANVVYDIRKSLSNPVKLANLQDLLQMGLGWFLNGEKISPSSRLLYPFVDQPVKVAWLPWAEEVRRLLPSDYLPEMAKVSTAELAEFLTRGYKWLIQGMENETNVLSSNGQKQFRLQLFDEALYRKHQSALSPILDLWAYANRYLTTFTYGVYLHGSMSTLDYVAGSSDVDALVIVNRTTLTSARRLLALRRRLIHTFRWFYAIDPFQHHGYFVLTEFDLANFDDALFPSAVLTYATTISGHQDIQLRYRSVCRDATIPFRKMAGMFRRSEAKLRPLPNWFEVKLYLQSMLLLPTLYLQALGKPVYKRDSFPLVKPQVPGSIWAIVRKGSDIRNLGWKKSILTNFLQKIVIYMPSPWILEIVCRRLSKRVPATVSQILGGNWRKEILDLVNYLVDDLARRGVET